MGEEHLASVRRPGRLGLRFGGELNRLTAVQGLDEERIGIGAVVRQPATLEADRVVIDPLCVEGRPKIGDLAGGNVLDPDREGVGGNVVLLVDDQSRAIGRPSLLLALAQHSLATAVRVDDADLSTDAGESDLRRPERNLRVVGRPDREAPADPAVEIGDLAQGAIVLDDEDLADRAVGVGELDEREARRRVALEGRRGLSARGRLRRGRRSVSPGRTG